ncbi:hypothetical protein B296_00028738 [Ensete ventricosum]|uniref:Transposase (putative) gypsy type domain-containing protein n=1 Tax=Ensete ventricosum TaxID=4639 RepID=A0A426ZRI9_ENSVE|nr:hypothetical protein B296_00028738 [Ensete ventricosum]
MTPMGTKVLKALMVMQSCYNNDSTMTVQRLAEVRNRFCIPEEYELHVPLPGQHPYDAFPDDFGLSIDALEVGLQFPLYPVIEACLDGWRISPSQMAPNSWRYMVVFFGECHGSGIVPAQDLFMACLLSLVSKVG